MIDLRDCETEVGERLLLAQRLLQLDLHARQMSPRHGNLILAFRRRQHTGRIVWGFREELHAAGEPPDRHDHHPVDRQEHQEGRDDRNDQGYDEDVAGITQHSLAQRPFVDDDFHGHLVRLGNRAINPEQPIAAEEKRVQGVADGAEFGIIGEIEGGIHFARHLRDSEQLRRAVLAQNDRLVVARVRSCTPRGSSSGWRPSITTLAAAAVFSRSCSQRWRMVATDGAKMRTSASMTKAIVSQSSLPDKPRMRGGMA